MPGWGPPLPPTDSRSPNGAGASLRLLSPRCRKPRCITRTPASAGDCLNTLDHYANDSSADVFRLALRDPVPRVRAIALHGLACERCRTGELCVSDVVPSLISVLEQDRSAKVRHGAVGILLRLSARDASASEAILRAAHEDADPLVRQVATAAAEGRHHDVRSRKTMRRRARRAQAA